MLGLPLGDIIAAGDFNSAADSGDAVGLDTDRGGLAGTELDATCASDGALALGLVVDISIRDNASNI